MAHKLSKQTQHKVRVSSNQSSKSCKLQAYLHQMTPPPLFCVLGAADEEVLIVSPER
jgi:hypothetical protein